MPGYSLTDGFGEVFEILKSRNRKNVKGYCYYHAQDLESAVAGAGLMIAFGDLEDGRIKSIEIGTQVKEILQNSGFKVEWDGNPDNRIFITKLNWKRRLKQ
jgi:hypothetical protein